MEVKEFNRSNAREISNRIQEVLDNLSDELGLTLKMDGGRFSDDKLTLKVEVTIQNEDGGRMISDQTNGRADREAKSEGISFKAPHFIGSIWKLSGRAGLCKVVDYKSKNRSYPFIVEAYESGKRFKAGSSSFRMGKELVPPTDIEFMKWFTLDVEDDTISPEDEEICDRINEYMSVAYPSEEFFDACGEIFDKGLANTIWGNIYSMLFQNGASLNEVTNHLQAILATPKRKRTRK